MIFSFKFYFCVAWSVHTAQVWTCGPDGRAGKAPEGAYLPAYLPACLAARLPACPWTVSCRLGGGWRPLRHITGPLIKTHVRQSDRHGKTVWKKLLGIKYIVTTWFQRFINKLTDHLVSIRSDRSTNPGISALGLVGGGRR